MVMKAEELRSILIQPESEELEFKAHLPQVAELAKLLASMANARGGYIIVGAKEGGEIIGFDRPALAENKLRRASDSLKPPLNANGEMVSVDGKPLFVISVPRSPNSPHLSNGKIFQRRGKTDSPITQEGLVSIVSQRSSMDDHMFLEVRRLSTVVESLNTELIAANKPAVKIRDMVVGGIIGAIISLLFALLFGVG
jgi:predicted HTH transcriptional regulator